MKEFFKKNKWIIINIIAFIIFISYELITNAKHFYSPQISFIIAISLIGTSITLYKYSVIWFFVAQVGNFLLVVLFLTLILQGAGNFLHIAMFFLVMTNIQLLIPLFKTNEYKENKW